MLGSFASLSGAFVATSSSAILNAMKVKPPGGLDERRRSCLTWNKIYGGQQIRQVQVGQNTKPLYTLRPNNAST